MNKKRTLLVAGGAGFIGSTFVAQSVERGDHVIVLDALTYAGHEENLSWIENKQGYTLVIGDITDYELVLSLLREHEVDAVVNFAAESHVDNSIHSPGVFIDTNIIGTYRMLEAARAYYEGLSGEKKSSFRYLQVSTDEVYGSLELDEDRKFHEETRMQPSSPYSASKAAGDHLVRAWFETYRLPTITTNCSNNYGPRQFPEKLIPRMIMRALAGESLPVYGDGKNIRDWIHVEDHCNGIYLALCDGNLGETYCLGGNAEKSNIDLVHQLCALLGELSPRENGQSYDALIKFVADRKGHDRRYAIDDSKAVETLNFKRLYTFEEGLRKTIEWYLANDDWCQAMTQKQQAA